MKVSKLPYRRVTREEMTDGLQRVIERVKAAQSVEEILAARAEYLSLTTEYATAQSLSYMRYTINTVDPFYLAEKDYYDEIGPEVENLALQYTSAVLDSPFRKELETALSPILLRSMELQRRSMSPEIIDDMVEENKLVSEYAQLMAGMLFPFRGEQLPRPMLMKYARSADRATRRACYEALGTTLEAHSAQLDDIFDRLVHVRDRMAKKMGYQNFIELGYCRMERMCYDVQAVQTFRENIVRDIVPVVSRLRLENAKRLGIDTFRLYDNEFFTPGGDPTPCGKDDLFAAAQKMYDAMGDVPGAFFRMMCENEAFDVESRPNKWGGGYCTEFPKFRQPFILANFNGTSGDVDVVTHEAGHALNAYLIADNRFALELGCGGMETAETHSMSMEFSCPTARWWTNSSTASMPSPALPRPSATPSGWSWRRNTARTSTRAASRISSAAHAGSTRCTSTRRRFTTSTTVWRRRRRSSSCSRRRTITTTPSPATCTCRSRAAKSSGRICWPRPASAPRSSRARSRSWQHG